MSIYKSDPIANRRDDALSAKSEISKLLDDCYAGGQRFLAGGHLMKYPREYTRAFKERQKRAVYLNYLQPIVDILIGFIFKTEPQRNDVPPSVSYLIDDVGRGQSMNAFMASVATKALMYTTGILVDSPAFNPAEITSQYDRTQQRLNPYACMYAPGRIRDFSFDRRTQALQWVLLDDSIEDKSDPFSDNIDKRIYTLWTTGTFQQFEIKQKRGAADEFVSIPLSDSVPHPVGYVPFRFVNWRDVNGDKVTDSPCEDIAIISRWIFNQFSYLDEMLASGTFSTLFIPAVNKKDVDDDIRKEGPWDIPVITWNPTAGGAPFFSKPGLGDVAAFKEALNLGIIEIFRKVGMDVDRDKSFVQSGVAKGLEFQKTEALLVQGAQALEGTENFIYETAARWAGDSVEVYVEYNEDFQEMNVDAVLKRLYDLYALTSSKDIQTESLQKIIEHNLPEVDAEKLAAQAEQNAPTSWLDSTGILSGLTDMSGVQKP